MGRRRRGGGVATGRRVRPAPTAHATAAGTARWAAHHARDTEPADGTSTRVEFTLEPEAGGTRLRVVETGFAALATSEENARRNHEDNVGGWREVLRMLDEYATQVAA